MKSGQRRHANPAQIAAEVQRLAPWFHNFELAEGVWTNNDGASPGPDYPAKRWHLIEPLLANLVPGKTCLDVGCSSGFFSLKLKELGASDVLGVDQGEQPMALHQARFAASVLDLDVSFETRSVYDLIALNREFDVVLFMGVLYHLRHPLLALETLRKVCKGTLILQSVITRRSDRPQKSLNTQNTHLGADELVDPSYPTLRFVEHALDSDTSCWFIPNSSGLQAMARSAGFAVKEIRSDDDYDMFLECT